MFFGTTKVQKFLETTKDINDNLNNLDNFFESTFVAFNVVLVVIVVVIK